MRKKLLIIGLTALFGISACNDSKLIVREGTSVQDIHAAAEKALARKKGVEAGDYYMEIERLYPYTPEAERSLILAAKSYHDYGALLESRIAAERYLQFFPGGKQAALATYLIALSYYDGITDIKRDQAKTFEALKALQIVMEKYPGSEYAKLARPKFDICLNQLAGKEMDIGRYYLAGSHFAAAIGRFKAVIDEYPENKHKPEAHHRLVEAYLAMGLKAEAAVVAKVLMNTYPKSPWAGRTKTLVETGSQSNAGISTIRQVFTGDRL